MKVGELQADRTRLEQEALAVVDDRHPAKRMALPVLVPAPVVALHQRQVVRLADLLERPEDTRRAAVRQVVEAHRVTILVVSGVPLWGQTPSSARSQHDVGYMPAGETHTGRQVDRAAADARSATGSGVARGRPDRVAADRGEDGSACRCRAVPRAAARSSSRSTGAVAEEQARSSSRCSRPAALTVQREPGRPASPSSYQPKMRRFASISSSTRSSWPSPIAAWMFDILYLQPDLA